MYSLFGVARISSGEWSNKGLQTQYLGRSQSILERGFRTNREQRDLGPTAIGTGVPWVTRPTCRKVGNVNIILVTALLLLSENAYSQSQVNNIWKPAPQTSWQWQLTGTVDLTVDAEMYDIDLFNNDASVVAALHSRNRKAVCYVSVGTFEDWRADAAKFPESVKGKTLSGFPNEKWLDIRQLDVLGPIMDARLDQCKAKGFDGVEPDNVDGYTNKSGFPLTAQDQIKFNTYIANSAHARGLSVGLKNDIDQIAQLASTFDWALNEQCFEYQECGGYKAFTSLGKAVFQVEYKLDPAQFCTSANSMNLNSLRKNLVLDAYRVPCRTAIAADTAPVITAVVNAASYAAGGVSPGEIVTVFGRNLGPQSVTTLRLTPSGLVDSVLDQTRILFDGVPAPLIYIVAGQATAVVPYGVALTATTRIQVERAGVRSAEFAAPVVTTAPGIFTADASGSGQAAMLNQDATFNNAGRPAKRGSVVVFYSTGEGQVTPMPVDGSVAGGTPTIAKPILGVTFKIGGQTAEILYAGAAPGLVSGVMQVNARVPDSVASGAAALELQVGQQVSKAGVTMTIE